jgi:hypothetical protein
VDYNLLRSWLGLPPGPWPPDHYTILGFPLGLCDPAAVEPRVMEKMDRLRHHQLLHPELVTEGMNRLAQALITLTDSIGRTAYDSELGIKPQATAQPPSRWVAVFKLPSPGRPVPVIVAEPVIDDDIFSEEELPVERPDPTELTQEIVLAGAVQAYAIVEELVPPPLELPFEDLAERGGPVVEGLVVQVPAVRPWPTPPSSRRWIYTRLALIRRARRGWEKLRPILGDPQDPIDRPGRMLLLLEAVRSVRPHLPALAGVVGGIDEPGGIVAAVINQPLLLDTLRRLLPDQRRALAIDWRRGQRQLQSEYSRLRSQARELRGQAEGIQRVPTVLRWLRDFPEILLLALALFALVLAAMRALLTRGHSP